MRYAAGLAIALLAAFTAFWIAVFEIMNHYGFNNQATPQYGFTSGVGPMILTALGMSTLISGLWHTHNCHAEGCLRIGRHKINGTPWCNTHHHQARVTKTTDELLTELIEILKNR